MKKILDYLELMRVHHYIKNFLVFLPLIFSRSLFHLNSFITTVIGFICFCLISSTIYIFNDIKDIDLDKKHKKKKHRPLPSGRVSKMEAIILGIICFTCCLLLNIFLIKSITSIVIVLVYFIMNVFYSIILKHVPIIDVLILSFGFLLRVLYGASITSIEVSNWLYVTVLSLSFYMGFGKRRNEYVKLGSKGRKVLVYYNESFLTHCLYMFMTLGIIFYTLWCMDIMNYIESSFNFIWTVPLVIVITLKYTLDIEGDSLGDPVDVILGDRLLMLLAILYASLMFVALYFFK